VSVRVPSLRTCLCGAGVMAALLGAASLPLKAQISAPEAVKQMLKGINLGNTFDAPPGETGWGNPTVQEYYFDDYKAAGFTAVRIPVTWDQHTQGGAPYNVDAAFMNRVEQVVDWGLSRGLFIIINGHHEGWIKANYSQNNQARYDAIWRQVAARFANKSDRLLFEILNEPETMALGDLNALNARVLGIIRNSGGANFTRNVIFAGTNWSSDWDLQQVSVPAGDRNHLIANFHDYAPWSFVSDNSGNATWGTPADRNAVVGTLTNVKNWANRNGVALMMNEWGCGPSHEYNSRMDFFQTYVSASYDLGISTFTWDDGGNFRMYNRNGRSWIGDVKDIITCPIFSPSGVKAVAYYRSGGPSGVQREATTDSGNERAVGFIDTGDWMTYRVDVPAAGTYRLDLRVASPTATGVISVQKAGGNPVYGTLNVPSTGGWQAWTTISRNITLPAGTQELAISAQVGGFNLNWLKLTPVQNPNTLTVNPGAVSLPQGGGSAAVAVASNTSWTVTNPAASWLAVTPVAGSNNGSLIFQAGANTSASARTATVTVSGGGLSVPVTVSQSGQSQTTIPIGRIISLKASANGLFVCADNAGAGALIANRTAAAGWEQFKVVDMGNGNVALLAQANQKYVCADTAGTSALIANRATAGAWESFAWVANADGTVALKALANNQFVCADLGKSTPPNLWANRAAASGWESFVVTVY